jgi:hypothetical protein
VSLCLAGALLAVSLEVTSFNLVWTHSVEKIEWQEQWQVVQGVQGRAHVDGPPLLLQLVEARVQGSGAGMEPPPNALREGPWWVWQPEQPALPVLRLAVSGATGRAWQLCTALGCRDLEAWLSLNGQTPGSIEISAAPRCRPGLAAR